MRTTCKTVWIIVLAVAVVSPAALAATVGLTTGDYVGDYAFADAVMFGETEIHCIESGTYWGQIIFSSIAPTTTVTFEPGIAATLANTLEYVNGKSNVRLNGSPNKITFDGSGADVFMVGPNQFFCIGPWNNLYVNDIRMKNIGDPGRDMHGNLRHWSGYVQFTNCEFYNDSYGGAWGCIAIGSGIQFHQGLFENCSFVSDLANAFRLKAGGIQYTFKNCYFKSAPNFGIWLESPFPIDDNPNFLNLENCFIYNNAGPQILATEYGVCDINMNHCFIGSTNRDGSLTRSPYGVFNGSFDVNVSVTNCIFDGEQALAASTTASPITYDYNLFCGASNTDALEVDYSADNNIDRTGQADNGPWYAGGSGPGDISFMAAGTLPADLHLAGADGDDSGGDAIDDGATSSETTILEDIDSKLDYDGDDRATDPDIGPDEFAVVVTPTPTEVVCTPGDLDNDGDADLFDVLRLVDIVLDLPPLPTAHEWCAGDLDDDGDFDLFDILAVVDIVLET